MKKILIYTIALLSFTANVVTAQPAPEHREPSHHHEKMEDMKKNREKIAKAVEKEKYVSSNIAVDLFILQTYIAAATSLELSNKIERIYLGATSDGRTKDKIPTIHDVRALSRDVEAQAKNVIEVTRLAAEATKSAKAEPNIARKAKVIAGMVPAGRLSTLIANESKMQVEMIAALVDMLTEKSR